MCRCDDLRLIKQDAGGSRTSKQDFLKQKTLTTANIHDAIKPAEIIGFEHRLSLGARVTGHGAVENSLFFRVLHPIGPSILPMRQLGSTFSGFDAVEQIAPGLPLARCSYPSRVVAPGARRVAGQADT